LSRYVARILRVVVEHTRMGMRKIVVTEYTCERCEHPWVPRKDEKPRICPKCKSAWWDVPKPKAPKKGK
jgi:predicted Zn-ribbon and HTH transcriptional regulator